MSDYQPQTTFILLSNVPLDHSHKNERWFSNETEQLNFFSKYKLQDVQNGTYQRKTVGVINVPFLYDDIATCNYIMWQNGEQSSKWYYAFVLELKYVNPNVTQIIYDLDVIQTYMFDMQFKECYINRQHEKRFAYTSDDKKLNAYINREVEDLDYGSCYDLYSEQALGNNGEDEVGFLVGATTYKVDGSEGKIASGIPLNLIYFAIPVYIPSKDTTTIQDVTFSLVVNGTIYELAKAYNVLTKFSYSSSLVNSLVSLKFYPTLPGDIEISKVSSTSYYIKTYGDYENYTIPTSSMRVIVPTKTGSFGFKQYGLPAYTSLTSGNMPSYTESKLYMYPYTYGVLTNKRGDEKVVRLEDLKVEGDNQQATALTVFKVGSISNSPKIGYLIANYLTNDKAPTLLNESKYNLEEMLVEELDSDVPIVDDYSASYIQSNSNAIKVNKSNAQAYLQSAQQQASNTYNTGMQVLDNKSKQAQNNLVNSIATAGVTAVGSGVSAVTSNIGNVGRQVGEMATTATTLATSIMNATNTKQNEDTNIRNSALVEKNTLKNANISATTDYQTTIASINAKVQDAQNVPASAKQLGGDYLFNCLTNATGLYFQIKTIKPYYVEKLTKYFEMYGYKVNKREVPNLHTRKSWNYIKMADANIFGNIPQSDLMSIRDIFMQGITLWHTDDIGNYSLNNDEI